VLTDHAIKSVIREMSPADIARGVDLVRMAGWNQTEDDWAIMLRLGRGYGIHDDNGRLLASSVIIPYPPHFGWIGMVLVDETARRRGFATQLLDNAIAELRKDRLVPMLDATPAGREVYRRIGFADVAPIDRWRGKGTPPSQSAAAVYARTAEPTTDTTADERAFGALRGSLLFDFACRPGALTLTLPDERGALWSRAGRTATQIGPVVARNESDAQTLVTMALDRIGGPVLLDVPRRETAIAALLSARGFAVERSFTRMALGAPSGLTLGAEMRIIAGPELG
jgi:GNAT superfamily N-acetyltransferase